MGHLRAYRAAVGGKHPDNKTGLTTGTFPGIRRLILAIGTLLVASVSGSASYAESGPFAGMAGNWSGGGTVTLDDGSSERLRCRATYAVGAGGTGLNLSLTCASDSYRFILSGGNGNFQVVANAPNFAANLSLATQGNRQSIVIRAAAQFRGANIALTRR